MKKNTEWVQEISGKLIEKLLAKELGIEVENLKLLKYSCELITRENGECYYLNFDLDVYPEIVKNIKGISELGSLDIEESVIDVDKKFNVFLNTLLNTELYSKFLSEIKLLRESIEYLNENNIVIEFIKFQLYSSMVTFMESYLKDTLMNIVLFNESINTKFIETFKVFESKRIEYNQLIKEYNRKNIIIEEYLDKIIYHNIPIVKNIYKDALEINFPEISEVIYIIKRRHDIVHRNGNTKKGKIEISDNDILKDIEVIHKFIESIELELREKLPGYNGEVINDYPKS